MCCVCVFVFFFFNDTATTEIYTLSLHDALPILLGEFLVHKNFGIGQYQGLKIITSGEKKYECIKLIYSNSSVLYLPVEDLTMIYKYHQQRKNTIHLSTLGTSKWLQEKHRANQSAKEIIKDIINTQALRSKPRGFIYDYNDDLYDSLARSFPYKETRSEERRVGKECRSRGSQYH